MPKKIPRDPLSITNGILARNNAKLSAALEWFVDREAAIQAKFDLHGPGDVASAMKIAFHRARKALNRK